MAHLTAVYGQLDQNDVPGYPQKRSGLSEQEQCDLSTLLMQALWTLPQRDAATASREVGGVAAESPRLVSAGALIFGPATN